MEYNPVKPNHQPKNLNIRPNGDTLLLLSFSSASSDDGCFLFVFPIVLTYPLCAALSRRVQRLVGIQFFEFPMDYDEPHSREYKIYPQADLEVPQLGGSA